jgi:glycine/D-amino acid oxidase-like deaminating enzyme
MQSGWLSGGFVAQTDIIVLGAGIVGTCCAVHLAKRGLSVALVDRGAVGEGTSYGNTGIITGETLFPPAFPWIGARSCASRSSARRKSIITSDFCRAPRRGSRLSSLRRGRRG